MARLGVNIDHVATIRQARGGAEPDPVAAAAIAELAGADGITIHLREDRRHIQDRDLRLLRQTIKTRLNLEMAATDEMVSIALSVKPDMCTLVPEKRQELTTEGGLDVRLHLDAVKGAVQKLQDGGSSSASSSTRTPIRSSRQQERRRLHRDTYRRFCRGVRLESRAGRVEKDRKCHQAGRKAGLGGQRRPRAQLQQHQEDCRTWGIEEYNIGHSIISKAVLVGLDRAVRDMVDLVKYS
ncbi:pyridoxine 5'-phosphate synthase [Geotalea toluenoxydans]|uniref:pyridoxine 5'-phosphate synthase n=1 Tax=Geotalea toluenoxydans TaxID=421624 RepID=UPI000AE2D1DF|nr:pyridoxine 5'-phosphate synthase [Geotalea toluenoxydans]